MSGKRAPRLPNTICLATPGWKGETQVMQMDLAGFAVSSGSACSSGKVRPSRVLRPWASARRRGWRDPGLARAGDDRGRGAGLRVRPGNDITAASGRRPRARREERRDGGIRRDRSVRDGVDQETVDAVRHVGERYKYGFSTEIDTEYAPKGLNEDIVRLISEKNGEPQWLTDWRLQAFARWKALDGADLGDGAATRRSTSRTSTTTPGRSSMTREAEVARRGRSDPARDLREARHPAEGADDPRRGRGRRGRAGRGAQGRGGRGVRQRLARDHLQGGAGQGRA